MFHLSGQELGRTRGQTKAMESATGTETDAHEPQPSTSQGRYNLLLRQRMYNTELQNMLRHGIYTRIICYAIESILE